MTGTHFTDARFFLAVCHGTNRRFTTTTAFCPPKTMPPLLKAAIHGTITPPGVTEFLAPQACEPPLSSHYCAAEECGVLSSIVSAAPPECVSSCANRHTGVFCCLTPHWADTHHMTQVTCHMTERTPETLTGPKVHRNQTASCHFLVLCVNNWLVM